MAKKHPAYKPQLRRKPLGSVASGSEILPTPDHESTVEETIGKLSDLFEIDSIIESGRAETALGSILASYNSLLLFEDRDDLPTLQREDLLSIIPDMVNEVRNALQQYKDAGIDLTTQTGALSREQTLNCYNRFSKEVFGEQLPSMDEAWSVVEGNVKKLTNGDVDDFSWQGVQSTIKMRLLRVFMSSAGRISKLAPQTTFDNKLANTYLHGNFDVLSHEIALNPSSMRRKTAASLAYIMSPEVTAMLKYFEIIDEDIDSPDSELYAPVQELTFEVLPAGTDLRAYAEDLVASLGESERAHVDLQRVVVLEQVRQLWGEDSCYYARGKRSGKQLPDEAGNMVDEDYLLLIMQNLDYRGNSLGENALAISPIAGKHAAYLVRHDTSAGTWREVLPLSKKDAREVGARDLRFTASSGHTAYTMMTEKVRALLNCHSDDFLNQLRMCGDGSYRVQTSRSLAAATKSFTL